MKTIDKLSFVPLLALLLFAGSCEKDGGVFMRENDAIACDCTEQSISQNVLCDGEWKFIFDIYPSHILFILIMKIGA